MCALFKNRYLIGSKRCRGFDYSSPGKYFITICTKSKMPYFGKIENGNMLLSELGVCLQNEWLKTPAFRPDMNISLDEFVIPPDHFHAIIIIGKNSYNQKKSLGNNHRRNAVHIRRNAMHGVSTIVVNGSTTMVDGSTMTTNEYKNTYGPQSKNLLSIIRGIKSAVTMYAKKMKLDFSWQPRYHDHIIRTNRELSRIRKYIIENPENWISDSRDFYNFKQ